MKGRNQVYGCVLALCVALISCERNSGYVIAMGRVGVLERPYPPNYPSSAPLDNREQFVLVAGDCIGVVGHEYGKDFMVYEVKSVDGLRGFVAVSSPIVYVEEETPAGCTRMR